MKWRPPQIIAILCPRLLAWSVALVSALAAMVVSSAASADQIVPPPKALERDERAEFVYELPERASGTGVLAIEWQDSLGRLVERFAMPFRLSDGADVPFVLDLRRAVALQNDVRVRLTFDGMAGGETVHWERDQHCSFSVVTPEDPWTDYQVIIWQPQTRAQYAALKEMGVTAGMVEGSRLSGTEQGPVEALMAENLGWYVENIATDFYAPYHRWSAGRSVNWRFAETKRIYAVNPADPAAFARVPSLSDRRWLRRIGDRLADTVGAEDAYRPLFYNLADEPGIADLSIFWDFDLSPPSLAGMRTWLRGRYRTLSALNRQWGSEFQRWNAVMPMTTRDATERADDNYGAWADFKEWMDEAFARALRAGTDAIHKTSPRAYAAIEGAQIPGWGGYDYSRLVRAVDVIELSDGGGNLEIARSLNPQLVLLTTLTADAPHTAHDIWRELLRGTRGVILWDPRHRLLGADDAPGARAGELAGALHGLRNGLGALLISSRRQTDPIAILYSPASMRTQWILDWKSKGDAWAARDIASSYEEPNAVRAAMVGYAQLLENMGWHPRFITSEQIENGELERGGYRFLILPHIVSLGPETVRTIRHFAAAGGTLVADLEPGAFDDHSRRRAAQPLGDLFAAASMTSAGQGAAAIVPDVETCGDALASPPCVAAVRSLSRIFAARDFRPTYLSEDLQGEPARDVDLYPFKNGAIDVIGVQRRRAAPEDAAALGTVRLLLPEKSFACDLRALKLSGPTDQIVLALRGDEPDLVAISRSGFPHLALNVPSQARAGEVAELSINAVDDPGAGANIVHIDVLRPSGAIAPYYSRNLRLPAGGISLPLPFAENDPAGHWTIRLTSPLACETIVRDLDLTADGHAKSTPR
jgi:hypothetical protein